MKEICLVEVTAWFVKEREQYWADKLNSCLWETEPETSLIAQPTKDQSGFCDFWGDDYKLPDIYFTSPNIAFSFLAFGESTSEDYTNPIDYLMGELGEEEVFRGWLPHLKQAAKTILSNTTPLPEGLFGPTNPPPPPNHVNFVTAWSYEGYQTPETSYGGGDWEEDWQLLGVVDLYKLPIKKIEIPS